MTEPTTEQRQQAKEIRQKYREALLELVSAHAASLDDGLNEQLAFSLTLLMFRALHPGAMAIMLTEAVAQLVEIERHHGGVLPPTGVIE